MGQCDACGEDQISIQLCGKCVAMWEQKFKRGETMHAYYFGALNEGKTVLSPQEYRNMNKKSTQMMRENKK